MRRAVVLAVVGVVLVACGGAQPTIRQADLDAWKGAPLVELETHSMFSTMARKTQPLSDGGELWTYSVCERWRTDTRCTAVGNSGWAVVNCNGGQVGERCCHNQFYVKDKIVGWYRPRGSCFTDCDVRPPSRACTTSATQ